MIWFIQYLLTNLITKEAGMKSEIRKYLMIGLLSFVFAITVSGCSDCNCDDGFSFNLFSRNHKIKGSGIVTKEARDISGFSEVILSEKGDLYIEVGDREELIIETEDNLQEYLLGEVDHHTLRIYKSPENVTLETNHPITYFLTVKELDSLVIQNSGDVFISELTGEELSVGITGSGSVFIDDLQVNTLNAELTSSGRLEIASGIIETQSIHLSSSGVYHGGNLESQYAFVDLYSSGSATVNVMNSLTVDISSSGDVVYMGDPSIDVLNMSSSGKLRRAP
jgi:hypothetical protein